MEMMIDKSLERLSFSKRFHRLAAAVLQRGSENDMSLEVLQNLFRSIKVPASIVEVAPAVPEMTLDRDAYLEASYPNGHPVIIWIDIHSQSQLRFQVIVADGKEEEKFQRNDLLNWAASINQLMGYFGALSTGVLGIMLEYRLPYQDVVASSTITSVARCIAEAGMKAKENLYFLLNELSGRRR